MDESKSITQKFVDAFDPSNKDHVKWLKKFFDFAKNVAEKRKSIEDFIKTNPFGIEVSQSEMLEWVHIHFVMSMKYSREVLNGTAWIPN
jgi:hypothetical protein